MASSSGLQASNDAKRFVVLPGCEEARTARYLQDLKIRPQHSDAELQAICTEAQKSLFQKIDLNPLQPLSNNVRPDTLPGDPRAWSLEPHQLLLAAVPDVSSKDLLRPESTDPIQQP
jgi:hypothetical protein